MSRSTLFVPFFTLFTVSAAAQGPATRPQSATNPAPATTPTEAEFGALIQDLRAEDYPSRVKAQSRLAAMGEAARPLLEQVVAKNADPEIVDRVRVVLAGLDRTRQFGPTPVTLHVRGVPASEALAAIAAQANVTFAPGADVLWPDGAMPPRVKVDCDGAAFWSVVQQVCAQAGLRVASSSPGGPVQLAVGTAAEPMGPWAVAGPFLFKVKRIERTRGLTFDGPRDINAANGVRISLFCWAEPKVSGAAGGLWTVRQFDELVTDTGQSLEPKPKIGWAGGNGSIGGGGNEGTFSYRADVPGARLARLRVTASFTLPGKTQSWEVENVMRAGRVERQLGGYPFVLKEVSRVVEGRYAYTVEVGPGDHSPDEFQGLKQALQRKSARLIDAQGQALRMVAGSASMSQTAYTATQQMTDDLGNGKKTGPPVKFVWDVPVDSTTLNLPVEFTDIPLP